MLVRVRPTIGDEVSLDQAVTCPPGADTVCVRTDKHEITCGFDGVLAPTSSQTEVYSKVKHVVGAVAEGVNCTIFAYGQTGSGKTHTMLGAKLEEAMEGGTATFSTAAQGGGSDEDWGIIPRVVVDLFQKLAHGDESDSDDSVDTSDNTEGDADDAADAAEKSKNASSFVVHANYMQIYNNTLYDLLSDPRRQNPLVIRETLKASGGKDIFVQGVSEFRVSSAKDVLLLLQHGGRNRAVRSTNYNEHSSRSHAILQMTVEVRRRSKPGGPIVTRTAKLNLVDLAGSERWDTSGAGANMHMRRELTQINTSLSALGNCISRLSEQSYSHVPYRDSQLTRLLEDSLGGNTRTVVLATITLLARDADVTESTLKFADRARQVMVRVKPNQMIDDKALLKCAEEEAMRLRRRVLVLTEALLDAGLDVPSDDESLANGGRGKGKEPRGARSGSPITGGSGSGSGGGPAESSVGLDQSEMISQLRRENMRLRSDNSELRTKSKQQAALLAAAPSVRVPAAPYALPGQVSGPPPAVALRKKKTQKKRRRRGRRGGGNGNKPHGRAMGNPYATTRKSRLNKHGATTGDYGRSPSAPHLPVLSAVVQQRRQQAMARPEAAPSTEEQCHRAAAQEQQNQSGLDARGRRSLQNLHHMGFAGDFSSEGSDEDDDDDNLAKMGFGGGVSLAGRLEARVAEQGDWEMNEGYKENGEESRESDALERQLEEIKGRRREDVAAAGPQSPESPETEGPTLIDPAPAIPVFPSPSLVNNGGHTFTSSRRPDKSPVVAGAAANAAKRRGKRRGKNGKVKPSRGPGGSTLVQRQTKKEIVMERRRKIEERQQRMSKDVGKRISVYSSRYDEWAPGEIVDIDAERRMHCIQYDEGERRWHRMDMLKFCLG